MTDVSVAPGWYADPDGSGALRWWDGSVWANHFQPAPTVEAKTRAAGRVCSKCQSGNILVQGITETNTKHRGCLGWTMWILLAVLTFGLIIIIPILTNSKTKSKTRFVAICQNCGHRMRA